MCTRGFPLSSYYSLSLSSISTCLFRFNFAQIVSFYFSKENPDFDFLFYLNCLLQIPQQLLDLLISLKKKKCFKTLWIPEKRIDPTHTDPPWLDKEGQTKSLKLWQRVCRIVFEDGFLFSSTTFNLKHFVVFFFLPIGWWWCCCLTGKRSRAVLYVLSPPPCVKEIRQSESHTNYQHSQLSSLITCWFFVFVV